MQPLLSWVVAGLSAFLLVTGGFLLARALLTPSARRLAERERRAGERLEEALAENALLRGRVDRALEPEATRKVTLRPGPQDDFGESTVLPRPKSYFQPPSEQAGAPGLERISEGEYEIQAAAPPGLDEEEPQEDGFGDVHRDETRQFSLHSPEAVVHFLQRIDELSDENRELRATLAERERQLEEHRAEGGEQVQRFASLDATATLLREELKRRGARIKQLEEQLEGELRGGEPARSVFSTGAEATSRTSPVDRPGLTRRVEVIGAPEDSTMRVQRLGEADLEGAPPYKKRP